MRVVLITGASSGIERLTAKKLSKLGFNLILCGRNEKRLLDLKNSLLNLQMLVCLVFDVRNKKNVFKQIGSLDKKWKDIDVLINNAANGSWKKIRWLTMMLKIGT